MNVDPSESSYEESVSPAPESPVIPAGKPMGFFDHLEELRWTLIKCTVTFLIFAVVIGYFLKEFNDVLLRPLYQVKAAYPSLVIDLGSTTLMEPFSIIIQMCVSGGLVLSAPLCLLFIAQFVSPALTERELKAVLPLCVAALILFLLGAAFSYFLLVPSTIRMSIELNNLFGFAVRWTPGSYYSMLTWLVIGVGATFEFPLVIILLVWLGLLTTAFLRKYRRHAIVAIFILAAIVTPTSDPITQLMFVAPLYVLYEIAILVSARVEKRRRTL